MGIDIDEKFYNYMSMELIEPIKYILNKYKKREAISQFKSLFYNEDVIESLQNYTGNSFRIKLLADCIPSEKWNKMYWLSKTILIVKGD